MALLPKIYLKKHLYYLLGKYCQNPCFGLNYRAYKIFFPETKSECDLKRIIFSEALRVYKRVKNKKIFDQIKVIGEKL